MIEERPQWPLFCLSTLSHSIYYLLNIVVIRFFLVLSVMAI